MSIAKVKFMKMKDKKSNIRKRVKKARNEIHAEILEDEVKECKQELFGHKKELNKSKQLEKDLRKDTERLCVEHDKLNNKSACAESKCDA